MAAIFKNFFARDKERGNHFIIKVLQEIKRLSRYTENRKRPLSSLDLKKTFQYLDGTEINLTDLRLMMVLTLLFMSFVRFSKLPNLKGSDFILHNTHM